MIPHVGKSHLTYRLIQSIPDEHKIVLVDGSFVQDMGTLAVTKTKQIDYVHTNGKPECLARNWNIGAARVPKDEPYWIFCANDIEFQPHSWHHIQQEVKLYPDCGIIKDQPHNWNVWLVRRWAWDLLKPMDEGYKPCAGEDDDLNMKCHASGIKIRAGDFRVISAEGGHGSRIDMHRPGLNSIREIRPRVVGHFYRKWGIKPSFKSDPDYQAVKKAIYVGGRRRKEPPRRYETPTERGDYGPHDCAWPDPLKLNLGCGPRHMAGFCNVDVNCDVNVNPKPDYPLDIAVDPWPWGEGSVKSIESFHFIEHVTHAEAKQVAANCFRVLGSGGTIAFEAPDMIGSCVSFLKGGSWKIKRFYGNHTTPWQVHKWGYTQGTLAQLFKDAGFRITHKGVGTDYHQDESLCIRVEGVKP